MFMSPDTDATPTEYDFARMFSPAIAREYATKLVPDPRQIEYNERQARMDQIDRELEVDHFLRQHTFVSEHEARDLQDWFDR